MKNPQFADYLGCFPLIELPVTITVDSRIEFAKANKPFPQDIIETFLIPLEGKEIDEFTEFEPCFRIEGANEFNAVIYWRGKIYSYEYLLVTYDRHNKVIARKSIAGSRYENDLIFQSAANISEDYIISIVAGQQKADQPNYSAEMSQSMTFEILSTGEIIFSLQDI